MDALRIPTQFADASYNFGIAARFWDVLFGAYSNPKVSRISIKEELSG